MCVSVMYSGEYDMLECVSIPGKLESLPDHGGNPGPLGSQIHLST